MRFLRSILFLLDIIFCFILFLPLSTQMYDIVVVVIFVHPETHRIVGAEKTPKTLPNEIRIISSSIQCSNIIKSRQKCSRKRKGIANRNKKSEKWRKSTQTKKTSQEKEQENRIGMMYTSCWIADICVLTPIGTCERKHTHISSLVSGSQYESAILHYVCNFQLNSIRLLFVIHIS